jgi:hypothetical protein
MQPASSHAPPAGHYRVADNVNRGRGPLLQFIQPLPGLLTGCAYGLDISSRRRTRSAGQAAARQIAAVAPESTHFCTNCSRILAVMICRAPGRAAPRATSSSRQPGGRRRRGRDGTTGRDDEPTRLLLRWGWLLRRSAGDIMFCPSTKREQSVPGQARLLLLISGLAAAVVASSAAPAPPPPKCNGGFCSSLAHYPCAGTTHYAEFNVPELPLAVGPTFFVYYNIDWQAAGPKGSAARMNQFVPQLMLGHPLDGSSV